MSDNDRQPSDTSQRSRDAQDAPPTVAAAGDGDAASQRWPGEAMPADATMSLTGQTWGDFVFGEMLGKGGMGVVYRGRQVSLDRVVAIKVLPRLLASHQQFRERFMREARAVGRIASEHVVQVYVVGQHEGQHFYAMEYVEGKDLARRLRTGWKPSHREALDIVLQAARGLRVAGELGLVHRDIKPGNLIMTAQGVVKLMDFGLVRVLGDDQRLTHTGVVMGTASYFSPEQGRGDAIDQRSDIYALGVVFFELLTGRVPFNGDSPTSVIYQHIHEPARAPRELDDSIPSAYDAIVMRCLAKRPEHRFQTAADLVAALELVAAGRSRDRRGRLVAALAVAAVLAVAVVGVVVPMRRAARGQDQGVHQPKPLPPPPALAQAVMRPSATPADGIVATQVTPADGTPSAPRTQDVVAAPLPSAPQVAVAPVSAMAPATPVAPATPITPLPPIIDANADHSLAPASPLPMESAARVEATTVHGGAADGASTAADSPHHAHAATAAKPPLSPPGMTAARSDERGWYADLVVGAVTQRFRWIVPGVFRMGSPDLERGRDRDETEHEVRLTRGLWLADSECTQALWREILGESPSRFDDGDQPVEMISRVDCERFLVALAQRMPGLAPRLPSEAEWEYACRAGTIRPYLDRDHLDDDNACFRGASHPALVKSYAANAWGLYDMLGNVREWCADTYEPYPEHTAIDPFVTGGGRVVTRGGGWLDATRECRAASRMPQRRDVADDATGLRIALDAR